VANEPEEIDDFPQEETASLPRRRRPAGPQGVKPPRFATVMAIIDLLISLAQLTMLPFVVATGSEAFGNSNPQSLVITSAIAVVAEGMMSVCGLATGIGIVMKRSWALVAGWMTVGMTSVCIGVGVVRTMQMIDRDAAIFQGRYGDAARLGAFGSLVGFVLFRLAWLGCYAFALSLYAKWLATRKNPPAAEEGAL
jgi:hypothetical protein